jgi:hypothetical protein
MWARAHTAGHLPWASELFQIGPAPVGTTWAAAGAANIAVTLMAIRLASPRITMTNPPGSREATAALCARLPAAG